MLTEEPERLLWDQFRVRHLTPGHAPGQRKARRILRGILRIQLRLHSDHRAGYRWKWVPGSQQAWEIENYIGLIWQLAHPFWNAAMRLYVVSLPRAESFWVKSISTTEWNSATDNRVVSINSFHLHQSCQVGYVHWPELGLKWDWHRIVRGKSTLQEQSCHTIISIRLEKSKYRYFRWMETLQPTKFNKGR